MTFACTTVRSVFFFKQKTAYEMRISDWSSDVCSSDLKAGLEDEALAARFARIAEVPFSSERKLMSTIHGDAEREKRLVAFTKGAPDVLLARCSQELVGEEARPLTVERRTEILASNEELAGEGLRTLGDAFRLLPQDAPGDEASGDERSEEH